MYFIVTASRKSISSVVSMFNTTAFATLAYDNMLGILCQNFPIFSPAFFFAEHRKAAY